MDFIRPSQLAEQLNVSESTLRQWIATGRLPPPRRITERTLCWSLADLQTWFANLPTVPPSACVPTPLSLHNPVIGGSIPEL